MYSALIVLWSAGCAYRTDRVAVSFGPPAPVALVQPSIDRQRWYVAVDSPAGPQLFFVDTGYDISTCDDTLIASLGLDTRGRARIRGEMGGVPATKAQLPPLELGGHRIDRIVCHVRDLNQTSSIRDSPEVPIAGVIGMDVLDRFRTVFDPAQGTMSLHDPDAEEPIDRDAEGASRLRRPPWPGLGRVRVEITLDGHDLWTMIDTGATRTFLDGERLGLAPSRTLAAVQMRGSGSSNLAIEEVQLFEIQEIAVGGLATDGATLMGQDRPWWRAGLLGLDLLSRFRMELDPRHRAVHFTPVEPMPLPQWASWTGTPGRLLAPDATPRDGRGRTSTPQEGTVD